MHRLVDKILGFDPPWHYYFVLFVPFKCRIAILGSYSLNYAVRELKVALYLMPDTGEFG